MIVCCGWQLTIIVCCGWQLTIIVCCRWQLTMIVCCGWQLSMIVCCGWQLSMIVCCGWQLSMIVHSVDCCIICHRLWWRSWMHWTVTLTTSATASGSWRHSAITWWTATTTTQRTSSAHRSAPWQSSHVPLMGGWGGGGYKVSVHPLDYAVFKGELKCRHKKAWNKKNVQTFPSAVFVWLFQQYLYMWMDLQLC